MSLAWKVQALTETGALLSFVEVQSKYNTEI